MHAGLALYEAGDIEAASTHMGHPIEEKYDAVAPALEAIGYGACAPTPSRSARRPRRANPAADVQALFDAVIVRSDAARDAAAPTARERRLAPAALGEIAAEEYAVALAGRLGLEPPRIPGQLGVRAPARREVLHDLDVAADAVFRRDGACAHFDRLLKAKTNLYRMWADG